VGFALYNGSNFATIITPDRTVITPPMQPGVARATALDLPAGVWTVLRDWCPPLSRAGGGCAGIAFAGLRNS
jgi:hypothetical protein